jgi:HlyD family secretion protein
MAAGAGTEQHCRTLGGDGDVRRAERESVVSDAPDRPDEQLERLLGTERVRRRFSRYGRWLAAAVLVVILVVGAYVLWRSGSGPSEPQYQTEAVTRGTLVVTVSATGHLQPTNQVDVGSELSGTIETVLVDVNDRVKKGQLIARIKPDIFEAKVTQARADLEDAEAAVVNQTANLERARADVDSTRAGVASARAQTAKAEVQLLDAKRDLDRKLELFRQELISRSDRDTAQATHDAAAAQLETAQAQERALASQVRMAEAQVRVAEALLTSAQAKVKQKKAALDQLLVDLDHTLIRSPIDGIVLARKVEPGQTVAASLQAPVLVTLAENLSQMELQVDVDEADVGQVREGQRATFTVDAYPGRKYPARIRRVNFGSQTKEGVISYQTVLTVTNDDLSLRPGMTGTAEITTATREHVLLVPNAALRFTPSTNGEAAATPSGGLLDRLLPRPPRRTSSKPAQSPSGTGTQQVWALRDGQPVALSVTVGVTNGRLTEVTGGELPEGTQVITESLGTSP